MEPGFARRERTALCDLLDALGPDRPTLCEGWVTADIAAHLVVRDSNPLALPGLVIEGLPSRLTQRFEAETRRSTAYPELVDRLRRGPGRWSVVGLPGLTELVNVHEYYLHHEDVRRANGEGPRDLAQDDAEALWLRLRTFGPWLVRRLRGPALDLVTDDGRRSRMRGGSPAVTLEGRPAELFLYLYNRKQAADVTLSGPRRAVAAVQRARLGV